VASTKTRHVCGRCGAKLREGEYIYSRFTKARYCIAMDVCAKRAAKKRV
jgi:hypothetical protein